ncbi:MAG: peptidoglycan-binding protein [Thioclava sp.]|nr:holin-associated N-acetylmuramidase [Thioclava sp.]MBD3803551.1 peptidoglycan-binding protein [Thioclava sp.]
MQTVQQIAEAIVAREGGFVNDPDDPGGATNYGVTIGTMRRLGLDLDRNGRVDTGDVRALTRAQAVEIFVREYFHKPGIDRLPEPLQASVFDMQVNAGSRAVKILQSVLNDSGCDLAVDGAIGSHTAAAAARVYAAAGLDLVDAYAIARRNYYYRLADARPASRKYARRRDGGKGGWITRAEEFMRPQYRLTEAQHKARVSKWA